MCLCLFADRKYLHDVWLLSLLTFDWRCAVPARGPCPMPPRCMHTCFYHPPLRSLFVWGGCDDDCFPEDMFRVGVDAEGTCLCVCVCV